MPKCPQCHSQSYRKNGRVRGKQRYRCKDCGRQFLEEALTVESPPEASNSGVSILLLDLENIRLDRGAESY